MTSVNGRLWALSGLVVVASSTFAIAHHWIDPRKPEAQGPLVAEAPSIPEAALGFTDVYRVTVEVGESVTVAIRDTQGCDAEIKVQSVTGGAATAKAKLKAELVRDQLVTVKGRRVGVSEATITVRGKDVVKGTGGPCTEDTKNKLVITVVESAANATREFGAAWKPLSIGLRADIRDSTRTAQSEIKSHIAALGSGAADVETAAMAIYASAHRALVSNQDSISTALSGFRSTGVGILTDGAFNPDCEPPKFGAGSGGPWDSALRDTYLQGFGGLQSVDKLMLGARTSFDKLTASGKINAQMTYQPGYFQLPAYSPPSQNPAPGTKSVNDLQIQAYGGITFQNSMDVMEGCLWFGGRYDPAKGAPVATLTNPFGATIVKTPTETGVGSWSVRYDDLTPGHTYRVDLKYADNTEHDSCALSLPWLDAK